MKKIFKNRTSFTLIELLVVLAIVAILSVVVIMTLNPSELIKQARDSTRLSDLSTLNTALAAFSADVVGGFTGTSTVVYVSVPDASQTCANLGLPALPPGYSYNCSTAANLGKTDGSGWIPVRLGSISFGAPISALPVDPVNTTTSRQYYTYMTGGSFELAASLEAQKNKLGGANDKTSSDGGASPSLFETGNNKTLLPVDYGDMSLIAYWKLDEASGPTIYDASGYGKNGVATGTSVVSGKSGNARLFNGVDNYIGAAINVSETDYAASLWFNSATTSVGIFEIDCDDVGACGHDRHIFINASGYVCARTYGNETICTPAGTSYADGAWHHVVHTFGGSVGGQKIYIDGAQKAAGTKANSDFDWQTGATIGFSQDAASRYMSGKLDEIRIYNRALSLAEVLALYNATR